MLCCITFYTTVPLKVPLILNLMACLIHFRLVTSGHLQENSEFFANFVEGERTLKQFCAEVVLNGFIITQNTFSDLFPVYIMV